MCAVIKASSGPSRDLLELCGDIWKPRVPETVVLFKQLHRNFAGKVGMRVKTNQTVAMNKPTALSSDWSHLRLRPECFYVLMLETGGCVV